MINEATTELLKFHLDLRLRFNQMNLIKKKKGKSTKLFMKCVFFKLALEETKTVIEIKV